MSLVVAIKDKNRIVLGADKQASTGYNKDHSCTKIWEVQELPGAIMGGVGSARASQIIQYSTMIDMNDVCEHGIDTHFIVKSLVPVIVGTLKSNGIACSIPNSKDEEEISAFIPNTFLFAYQDRAWMIWNDLSVTELQEYLAIGSGSDVANGALFATPEKNPFERIVTSIDAAAETTLFVDNGVDLLATKYISTDKQQIAKALSIEMPKEEKQSTKPKTKKVTKTKTTKENK